jgi:hypothetical protein
MKTPNPKHHIPLTVYDQNGLTIQPLGRSGSGKTYGTANKEARLLRFPFSNQEFIDGVERAWREAE